MSIQEFVAPHSLSEAKGLLSDGAIASVLAGGTDLLVGSPLGDSKPGEGSRS
jgi:CO/xanthine dehydrogenase FAD-binding subunit